MTTIYTDQKLPLRKFLTWAGADGDATLLIPNLQRPYIWDPPQVVVLVDSLIRGWPFGTLLTWSVRADDPARGLARPFWTVVDRTEDRRREAVSPKHPPAAFHMVLDGQQRAQSLLLAFGGDGWGFKLPDRRWNEVLTGAKPRGPRGRPHWSLGCLCVDLPALVQSYGQAKRATTIDYTAVLRWVITDDLNGQSKLQKPATYKEPLERSSAHPGRFVRLSRLWTRAPEQAGVDSYQAEEIADALLADHKVAEDARQAMLRPVGALLMALKDVKQIPVTYLELNSYENSLGTREAYNDAIINIFTRLNTAGRTLTREDITFAWIKGGWNAALVQNRDALDCFEELTGELKDLAVPLSVDDLVAAAGFLWSTIFNAGQLLTNSDLVKGEAVRPMASDLSENWSLIREAALAVSQVAVERGYRFRDQYQSVYALAYLWTWYFAALRWGAVQKMRELEKDSLDKALATALGTVIDRWLICTQWAGVWSAGTTLGAYAARLGGEAVVALQGADTETVVERLQRHVAQELRNIEQSAVNGLAALNADDRQEVRSYYTALWLWNRLEASRWAQAKVGLRESTRRQPTLEVDHVVAWNLWQTKLTHYVPGTQAQLDGSPQPTAEDLAPVVNELGNCMLLEKNFNISKSDRPLKDFLVRLYEFQQRPTRVEEWAAALELDMRQVDSLKTPVDTLRDLFRARTQRIRSDLEQFIRGTKLRVDRDAQTGGTGMTEEPGGTAHSQPKA